MVDGDYRSRVFRTLRYNSAGSSDGISVRGLKTVLCAHVGHKPQRVEEALEELIEKDAVAYDGEILRPVASER